MSFYELFGYFYTDTNTGNIKLILFYSNVEEPEAAYLGRRLRFLVEL